MQHRVMWIAVLAAAMGMLWALPASAQPCEVSGSLSSTTSPTQLGRIARISQVDSTICGEMVAAPFPGEGATTTTFNYETFQFSTTSAQCVTLTRVADCGTDAHYSAYLGAYDPTNKSLNYLGDIQDGSATSFSFDAPANSTIVIVVNSASANGVIDCDFQFTLSGATEDLVCSTSGGTPDAPIEDDGDETGDTEPDPVPLDDDDDGVAPDGPPQNGQNPILEDTIEQTPPPDGDDL